MKRNTRFGFSAFLIAFAVALPAFAYEYPLSEEAIRDAYFVGTRPNRASTDYLEQYTHVIPKLNVGSYRTVVTIETPYVQVANHARKAQNYHAQDAVEEFRDKPLEFRVVMDIYFWRGVSESAKIALVQNKKEITPLSVERSPLYPASDEYYNGGSIGEHVELNCGPETIDSSILTIRIETPASKLFKTEFDLAEVR
jgi:hypothetical protein